MTSYLKTEIFAYDLFYTVWLKAGLISHKYDASKIYSEECLTDKEYEEICDKAFYDAVLCRRILFQRIYMEQIREKHTYCDSVSEFYQYIHSMLNRYDWFDYLTVFERMLATCAFVINVCFYSRGNKNVDIVQYGHICWTMYFEEFTDEFYKQGGWNELKNVASSYTLPFIFLQNCLEDPENALPDITEAVENYNNLKQTSVIGEYKTVSSLWVKSLIDNLHRCGNIPTRFEGCENFLQAEYILNELKRLCNPCTSEVIQYDEECSDRSVLESTSLHICLTPTDNQELRTNNEKDNVTYDNFDHPALSLENNDSTLISNKNSLTSSGGNDIPERSVHNVTNFSFLVDHYYSKLGTDNGDYKNRSLSNQQDRTSDDSCNDISSGSFDSLEQPTEFESICIISESEQDEYNSKCMNSFRLNHETLELEETISETYNYINRNCNDIVTDVPVHSTTDQANLSKVTNKQLETSDDLLDAIESVLNDMLEKVSLTAEGKLCHHKSFKMHCDEFVSELTFSNPVADYKMRPCEWDEKELVKNTSTPLKQTIRNVSFIINDERDESNYLISK